jgi:hypothetical protein
MGRRNAVRVLMLLGLLLIAAIGPLPVRAADGSDVSIELELSTGNRLTLCVDEEERIIIGVRSFTISWLGLSRVSRGATVVDLTVDSDGVTPLYSGRGYLAVVPIQYHEVGQHTIYVRPRPPTGAGLDRADVQDETIRVEVVACHYEVHTRAIVHLDDGGFQPVLGATIDSAVLMPVALDQRTFEGPGRMTNVAVAFPVARCLPTFTVSDVRAHLVGTLSDDGQSLHLGIVWAHGTASFAGTGIQCAGGPGSAKADFQVLPVSVDLPAWGVSSAQAQPLPFTVKTGRGSYTGSIYVTLIRIRG